MKPATPRELLRFVNADEIKELRQDAALSHKQVANALGCSVQTVRNWEAGKTRVPVGYFHVLRFHSGYALPDSSRDGQTMHSGILWSPDNKGFRPEELGQLWLTVQKARLQERWQKPDRTPTAEPTQLALEGIRPIWKVKSQP